MTVFKIDLITPDTVWAAADFYASLEHSDEQIARGIGASVCTHILSAYGLEIGRHFKFDANYGMHGQTGKAITISNSSVVTKTMQWAADEVSRWFLEKRPGSSFMLLGVLYGQQTMADEAYTKAKAAGELLVDDAGETFRMPTPNGTSIGVTRRPDGKYSLHPEDLKRHLEQGGAQ